MRLGRFSPTRFRAVLHRSGLSHRTLEVKSQVSRSSIAPLLRGDLNPTDATVRRLAAALGCNVSDLTDSGPPGADDVLAAATAELGEDVVAAVVERATAIRGGRPPTAAQLRLLAALFEVAAELHDTAGAEVDQQAA